MSETREILIQPICLTEQLLKSGFYISSDGNNIAAIKPYIEDSPTVLTFKYHKDFDQANELDSQNYQVSFEMNINSPILKTICPNDTSREYIARGIAVSLTDQDNKRKKHNKPLKKAYASNAYIDDNDILHANVNRAGVEYLIRTFDKVFEGLNILSQSGSGPTAPQSPK